MWTADEVAHPGAGGEEGMGGGFDRFGLPKEGIGAILWWAEER